MSDTLALNQHDDKEAIGAYLASLASPHTQASAAGAIKRVHTLLSGHPIQWANVTPAVAAAIKAALVASDFKAGTVNVTLAHVRGVVRSAWRLGYLDADQMLRTHDSLKRVRDSQDGAYRSLTGGEVAALFDAARSPRDGLILALMLCGLRRSEVVSLQLADVDLEASQVVVHGKGNKARRVALRNGSREWLDLWLAQRGDEPGGLLAGRTTATSTYNIVKRLARDAGVSGVSPHRLRATCATMLTRRGVSLKTAARVLGHSNIETTARYQTVDSEEAWAAMDELHVPAPDPEKFGKEVKDE